MGNAESTTRMVAMQRDEDGVIMVSEDVGDRLRKSSRPRIQLQEGQYIVNDDELEGILNDALFKEKEAIRKRLETECLNKVTQVDSKWKEVMANVLDEAQKEKEQLKLQVEKTVVEKERDEDEKASSQKLAEIEAQWKAIVTATEERAMKEKQELQDELIQQAKKDAEAIEAQWQVTLAERVEEVAKEKEAALVLSQEEAKQKLEEAEAKWLKMIEDASVAEEMNQLLQEKTVLLSQLDEAAAGRVALLSETEEKLVKNKEELLLQLDEENKKNLEALDAQWQLTVAERLQEAQNEKELLIGQVEEENRLKLDALENKWQGIISEVSGSEVVITNKEEAKALIEGIEARWMAKLEEKEKEHTEALQAVQEDLANQVKVSDEKLAAQETLSNSMLEKLEKLQTKEDNLQEKFTESAARIEAQLKPLRQKAVCIEPRELALSCYRTNASQPLRCSQEVKKFMACVEAERIALLKGSTAS